MLPDIDPHLNKSKRFQNPKKKNAFGTFIFFYEIELILHSRTIFMKIHEIKIWYFVTKIVLTYCEKRCPSDREKLLKFEVEGREFAKILRSLEQFIQAVKGQNNFW